MSDPVAYLEEIRRLMELKGENPFKVRAFEKASQILAGRDDVLARAKNGTLTELAGIGKGISEVLTEFLVQGKTGARDELRKSLPEGLLELTEIPGLGPKKAMHLIEELEIRSVSELEYACRENRLLKLKGFGEKIQAKILEGISFRNANQGRLRLVDGIPIAEAVLKKLEGLSDQATAVGAFQRRLETMSELEFLIQASPKSEAFEKKARAAVEGFAGSSLPIRLHFAPKEKFGFEKARLTSTPEHWKAIGAPAPFSVETEEGFYRELKLPYFPPETRETGEEVALAKTGGLEKLLSWKGLRGVFHNHTVYSDGTATLEEMVLAAKKLGYEYIGISDHSQSAFYAQGLKTDRILEQEKEVRRVQERHPEIRIFWGIESDILADGSLDYDAKILKKFDFVVASIHSRFKTDRETMTQRILEAIRNPYTRFLGHVTGRLLLGRPGYELEMEKVIQEAAAHDVAIEINANPARLDIDWRWGSELRRHKTLVSVNPDAHDTVGLEDAVFGIAVARKALLPSELVVNSRGPKEIGKWLARN